MAGLILACSSLRPTGYSSNRMAAWACQAYKFASPEPFVPMPCRNPGHLHRELPEVLHEQQLLLLLQPIVSLRDSGIFGYEGLTRGFFSGFYAFSDFYFPGCGTNLNAVCVRFDSRKGGFLRRRRARCAGQTFPECKRTHRPVRGFGLRKQRHGPVTITAGTSKCVLESSSGADSRVSSRRKP